MMTLMRRDLFRPAVWDPFAEFERFTGGIWGNWGSFEGNARLPLMDVVEEEGSVVIKSELPGVNAEEIDVTLENGVMTIKAEHQEGEGEGSNYQSLSYYRSMTLPANIDTEKVSATVENGILEVHFPKLEALETRHVEVKAALKEPKPKAARAKRARKPRKEAKGKE